MAEFFDAYTPYFDLVLSGRHPQAVESGLTFLIHTKRFAPSQYDNTPKGTPFFLLGIAAYLSHDFQTATFFFDAAVSEDLKHNPTRRDAPALLTMQLKEPAPDQVIRHAASPIVAAVIDKIEATLIDYNGRAGHRILTLDDIRRHFLTHVLAAQQPHLRTLTTTFISFFFEWGYKSQLIEVSEAGSREPFFTHLFRGCLLFESLLKENPIKRPIKKTLGPVLQELLTELQISAPLTISSPSFESILSSLTASQSISDAIVSTGKTRNTLGHNLAWVAASMDATRYNLLTGNIAASCLHAISCLYR
jgi:hypothetical protein